MKQICSKIFSKMKWKKVIRILIVIAVLLIAGNFAFRRFSAAKLALTESEETITTAAVETRDIQNVLSSSGTIEPLNSYEVKTLVEGEVISADFEEGDIVQEGQILYQVDTDTFDNKIETQQKVIDRAKDSYDKAQESYRDALKDLAKAQEDYEKAKNKSGNANIKATETGIVKTLYVEEGDTIQNGTQIAEIYDNSYMLLTLPFSASEVDSSVVGKSANVIIEASNEELSGTVTKVSSIDETLSGNRLVNQVTIKVKNPGGITTATTATASIGSLYSSNEGTFQVLTETVLSSETSGEIESLKLQEGMTIKEGDVILTLTEDSVEDLLENYQNKVENAENAVDTATDNMDSSEDAIEDAESDMEEIIDTKTDYSITSPVTGKVISKNSLAGDTINSQTTLCVIYDLSAVTFEMNVDELDVMKVEVGQEVDITADALENVEISGIVTNISLESIANQGVTQYPVTVKITDVGDLLPGMNVTGEIIIEKVEGVLAIPSDALMRGDQVYVKDDTVTEADGGVPAGFKAVDVETGITDGDYVEIISGLTGTEEVYVQRVSEAVQTMMMPGQMGGGYGGNNTGVPSDRQMQRSMQSGGGMRSGQ